MNIKTTLQEQAGLTPVGKEEGEVQWLGTTSQWNKFTELETQKDQLIEDEIENDSLNENGHKEGCDCHSCHNHYGKV